MLKEQIARYRAIFEQAEDKVQMLSNALRQYLNQRENLPRAMILENQTRDSLLPPNNTRISHTSLTPRNSDSTRRSRSDKAKSRGASRSSSTAVTNAEQLATANASDIELLSCIFFISLTTSWNSILLTLMGP